jgi:hypothetical protein
MNENKKPTLDFKEFVGGLGISNISPSGPRLCVTVIATTQEGTTVALNAASSLARDLDAKIVLLKVEIVPPRFPVDEPPLPLDFLLKQQRSLLLDSSAKDEDVAIRICLCRDHDQCLLHVLRRRALVIIGGRRRWWTSAEEKLERGFRRLGHHVIFIDVGQQNKLASEIDFSPYNDRSAVGAFHEQSDELDSFFGIEESR